MKYLQKRLIYIFVLIFMCTGVSCKAPKNKDKNKPRTQVAENKNRGTPPPAPQTPPPAPEKPPPAGTPSPATPTAAAPDKAKADADKAKQEEEAKKKAAQEEAKKKAAQEEEAKKKAGAIPGKSLARAEPPGTGTPQDEAAKKKKAEEEAAKKKAEEIEEAAKKKATEEAARKKAEEEAVKKKAEEEAANKKAVEEATAKKKAEEEFKKTVPYLLANLDTADPTNYVINACVDDPATDKTCSETKIKKNWEPMTEYDFNWISLNLLCFQGNKKGELKVTVKQEKCKYFSEIKEAPKVKEILRLAAEQGKLKTFEDFVESSGIVPRSFKKEHVISATYETLEKLTQEIKDGKQGEAKNVRLMFHKDPFIERNINKPKKVSVIFIKPPDVLDDSIKIRIISRFPDFVTDMNWQVAEQMESEDPKNLVVAVSDKEKTKKLKFTFVKSTFGEKDTKLISVKKVDISETDKVKGSV